MLWRRMTLKSIESRLSRLERQERKGRATFFSTDFEKYEDYLVEAKKARTENPGVISSINMVPPAEELRECLQRMEDAKMDEDLIIYVKEELAFREEQDREYQNRLKLARS